MIAAAKPDRNRENATGWQGSFVEMLPAIVRHAKWVFRNLSAQARDDAVQEVAANAAVAFVRLVQLGKADLAYPRVLARYAVAHFREGRRVGNRLRIRDVLSPYAQRKKGLRVECLDRFDKESGEWLEAVVGDTRTPVPDQVAFRIDYPAWLRTQTRRNRRIARALADGNTTGEVARRFKISAARVSQLRRQFHQSWREFHGETPFFGA